MFPVYDVVPVCASQPSVHVGTIYCGNGRYSLRTLVNPANLICAMHQAILEALQRAADTDHPALQRDDLLLLSVSLHEQQQQLSLLQRDHGFFSVRFPGLLLPSIRCSYRFVLVLSLISLRRCPSLRSWRCWRCGSASACPWCSWVPTLATASPWSLTRW